MDSQTTTQTVAYGTEFPITPDIVGRIVRGEVRGYVKIHLRHIGGIGEALRKHRRVRHRHMPAKKRLDGTEPTGAE